MIELNTLENIKKMFKYLSEASKHFVFYDLRFTDPKSDYERFKNHFETAKKM